MLRQPAVSGMFYPAGEEAFEDMDDQNGQERKIKNIKKFSVYAQRLLR